MRKRIILSLGSNIGNRKENITKALLALKCAKFDVEKLSSFYKTDPVGFTDQDEFLNIAVSGSFMGEPEELLDAITSAEDSLGRVRVLKYGPRTIDIDIIMFGDRIIETEKLVIPHPEFRNRRFVLVPVAEIEPETNDPVSGKTMKKLLKECPNGSKVKKSRTGK